MLPFSGVARRLQSLNTEFLIKVMFVEEKQWKKPLYDSRKILQILVAKLAMALLCLYFFVCSLSFLATSFRLLSGRQSGKIFGNTELLQGQKTNPMILSDSISLHPHNLKFKF